MSALIGKRLESLWWQLQGKKPHMPHFLSEIRLQGIRSIEDIRVRFEYPVSVIAGVNASGKSTVLFAAACAYKVPGATLRDFAPSTLFPDYQPKVGARGDRRRENVFEFDYSTPQGRLSMRWRRAKSWNRSFFGRPDATQPERPVYLRTLSNLSNPAEVRGVLGMSRLRSAPAQTPLDATQLEFAQQMLPFRYSEVVDLVCDDNSLLFASPETAYANADADFSDVLGKSLLFASQESGAEYSELHMASGERVLLRLSQEIAQLDGALVLIDEVEASLHPWVQQLLMQHLQQLALRRNLQIIVTTHSHVVLDSVPAMGRIFLDLDEAGKVKVLPPHRDLVQDALYGLAKDTLNLLCEDETAEGILQGLLEHLLPREGIPLGSVRVGRNTGADEFPTHAKAFGKFDLLSNFVFVLDGDKRDSAVERKIRAADERLKVLFLPGNDAPEVWVWGVLKQRCRECAEELKLAPEQLSRHLGRLDSVFNLASDTPSAIAKSKLRSLGEALSVDASHICRATARLEAARRGSSIQPLLEGLGDELAKWRSS